MSPGMRNENDYCKVVIVVADSSAIDHVVLFFCGEEARRKQGVASSGVLRFFYFLPYTRRCVFKMKTPPQHPYQHHSRVNSFRNQPNLEHRRLLLRRRQAAGTHIFSRPAFEARHGKVCGLYQLCIRLSLRCLFICPHCCAYLPSMASHETWRRTRSRRT